MASQFWRRTASFFQAFAKKETWAATIVASALAIFVGPVVDNYVADHFDAAERRESEVRRAVERLRSEADAFQVFATTYAMAVTRDNRVDAQARERLTTNLINQKIALDEVSAKMPEPVRRHLAEYERTLLAMNDALGRVSDVTSMREFWERTSDLLVARQELFRVLSPLVA
jgi:hypothetical protein